MDSDNLSFRLTEQGEFAILPWHVVGDLIHLAETSISDDQDPYLAFAKNFVEVKGNLRDKLLSVRQKCLEDMAAKESCEAELWESEGIPTKFLFRLICLGYAPPNHRKRVIELADVSFSDRLQDVL
jgi:hypothetical protein